MAVTDEFFNALLEDRKFFLKNPRTGKTAMEIKAKALFDNIVEAAWECGEPGLLFIDRINAANPTPEQGSFVATNPCGEQPLLPWESCNLGSINLARVVRDNGIDWPLLANIVRLAIRFLDNVIEVNQYPLPQIEQVTLGNRKIGLGVMGFADFLIALGVPYDTEEAVGLADKVMGFIQEEAKKASLSLGQERGSFPNFSESTLAGNWSHMRNATVTSIAPTGSISLIAGCSHGIEPIFSLAHSRKMFSGRDTVFVHPLAINTLRPNNRPPAGLSLHACSSSPGSQKKDRSRDLIKCAHDISGLWHVKIQAAFQKHVDNAVSKTVNLPMRASKQDVQDIFLSAKSYGCKGITIYREGCKKNQILQTANLPMSRLIVNRAGRATCSNCG